MLKKYTVCQNDFQRTQWDILRFFAEFLYLTFKILLGSGFELIGIHISLYCCSISAAPFYAFPTSCPFGWLPSYIPLQLRTYWKNSSVLIWTMDWNPFLQQWYMTKSTNCLIFKQHFYDLHQICFNTILLECVPSSTIVVNKPKLWHCKTL